MIEHLDLDNDEEALTILMARLRDSGLADIKTELRAYRIQARDRAFGATVTMNLLGELTDISLPPLYAEHYEDAWDKAALSISALAMTLQARARSIAAKAIPFHLLANGVVDVQ